MPDPRLTIVIVSYKSADIITSCQSELLNSKRFRTIIIDNASPDGSGDKLKSTFPDVEVIQQSQNQGYGRAANRGFKETQTPYGLLLNPDLKVTASEIEALLTHVENDQDQAAIWGPATKKEEHDTSITSPVDTAWVSGGAMLFHMQRIREVGLFDENIFLFAEETDLCERVIKADYKIKLCPDVYFDHLIGQASAPNPAINYLKFWHFGWSQCYRMTKNGHTRWYKNPLRKWLNYRLHSVISSTKEKRAKWRAKADGARAFLRGEKAFLEDGSPQKLPQPKVDAK